MADHVSPDYLVSVAQNYTWADHVVVVATARLLKHDIWVVTSQKESIRQGYRLSKIKCGSPRGEPFVLGQLGEYHYLSLGMITNYIFISIRRKYILSVSFLLATRPTTYMFSKRRDENKLLIML